MMPVGFHSRIQSTLRLGGWISEYTRASRTRRAISCVNCDPKSRMRIRELMISSEFPLLASQREELDFLRVEIEHGGAGCSVQPSAALAGVHDECVAGRLERLLM